jgi:hypothetical protein
MRSTLQSPLAASFVVALALAVSCTTQSDPTDTSGSSFDSGGLDTGGEFAVTTGGSFGSGPMLPPGVWLKQYGDSADQKVGAFAVNSTGEVALTGSALGTIDFGNLPWTGSDTDADVVVAKLSKDGQALWSRRYGDSCDQHGGAVAFAPAGALLVAGDFCGKMDFGKATIEAAAGDTDLFVTLVDAFGDDIYARRIGGAGPQLARAAAVDNLGNAVLVGTFTEAFDEGQGALTSAGLDDIFVIKLDPQGKLLWSQRFGGPESDVARSVALDAKGNILVGGSFGGSVDFGSGLLTATPGHRGGFVVALDTAGKPLWSQGFAGDEDASVNSIAISSSGSVAATGSFTGTVDFGSGPTTSAGGEDVFLTMINSDGKPVWGRTFGGLQSQVGTGVAFGDNGDVAISGTSQEAIDFGLDGPLLTPSGAEMVYFCRFSSNGSPVATRAVGSLAPIESVGVGLDGKLGSFLIGSFQQTLGYELGEIESKGGWDIFFSRE